MLALGVVVFLTAFAFAIAGLPTPLPDLRLPLLAIVAFVGVPLSVLVNGEEFRVSLRLGGGTTNLRDSIQVALLGSLANLLPIPGAALVRLRATQRAGVPTREAFSITLAVAIVWLACALLMLGAVIAADDLGSGLLWASAGAAGLLLALTWLRRTATSRSLFLLVRITAVEAASTAIKAARIWIVLQSLGVDATPVQALALTTASIVATSVGFFPGGLGLAEALSAVASPLVGLDLSFGVLAQALDRVLGIAVLGLLFLPLLARSRNDVEAIS